MSPSETLTFNNSRGGSTEVLPMPLNEYAVTSNGFLPEEPPLRKLPNPYYGPWELLVESLPNALASRTLRDQVHQLPILSTDRLTAEPEWRRACVILGFLAHAYIWGGDTAAETLPPQITLPFLAVTTHLGTPPVATFASLSLWNFEIASTSTNTASTPSNTTPSTSVPDRDLDLTDPDALRALHTFTGTADESWFYMVSVAMEAEGARLLPVLLRAMHALFAARDQDVPPATTTAAAAAAVASRALGETTACIGRLGRLLDRMDERCRPDVFYHQIRPFLAGSKNMEAAGLPRGVFYAESAEGEGEAEGKANGKGEWRQLRGGSNGQSSLVQFLDIALGVEHIAMGSSNSSSGGGGSSSNSINSDPKEGGGGQGGKPAVGFHEEVRGYMPEPHRRFLEDVAARYPGGLRKGVEELLAAGGEGKGGLGPELTEVREAFQTATRALAEFRNKHLQMVTRYIIIPSRQQNTRREVNLATASSKLRASSSAEAKETVPAGGGELTGTGGTALMPFLKQTRDETFQAGRLEYR
ncbi:hypothetical protein MYCTH_2303249 [Thermothelomyces thermophilus ATCC 42464]|uniref:Indoleamine 2,3-dioxygenase n=1 Tax=Thermothelomyces thermophilus (strain ATCC 42464 / BCRC 31852 / DSM 1799) TaxID=573729 RepID=G2QCA9_THET4|nr:uncharacterized protein MYCTH_2303249 [Thermothelomyces thermophilus ATCC 42464]AEO57284.1 hypothetical protein MYCTH_2303249 [Thermothelomyces thermophilus ATCC 42464]